MKFLVDNNLSIRMVAGLRKTGHDVVHVSEYGMATASDDVIFDRAEAEDRVIISADTDFGTLLAQRQTQKPSVILLRLQDKLQRANEQVRLITENLPTMISYLEEGCIAVMELSQIRIRMLPLMQSGEMGERDADS